MSSILGLILFLLLLSLVLHVVARVLRVAVADESCQRRPWLPTHWREPIEEGEEVQFQSNDGALLSGTHLRRLTDACRGTIVFSHELNGDRWNALPYVEHLRTEGFDVFTFDYRNHGRSEAQCRWDDAFDVTEADVTDLRAAIRAAASKSSQADPVVGVVGVGKGAAIALCAVGQEPVVRGLLLDSIRPLPEAVDSVQPGYKPTLWLRLFRRRPARAFDVSLAARNVRVPVLFVHGRNDAHVGLDAVRTLASRVVGQCQLWVVPGARHAEAVQVDKDAYRRRSVKFFSHALHTKPVQVRKLEQEPTAPAAHHGRISSAPAQ